MSQQQQQHLLHRCTIGYYHRNHFYTIGMILVILLVPSQFFLIFPGGATGFDWLHPMESYRQKKKNQTSTKSRNVPFFNFLRGGGTTTTSQTLHDLNTTTTTITRTSQHFFTTKPCRFTVPSIEDQRLDMQLMESWKMTHSQQQEISYLNKYIIPVHFHVLQPSTFNDVISSSGMNTYIREMNEAFAVTPFEFLLASSEYTINTKWSNGCDDKDLEHEFKTFLKIGTADVLNVYFCNQAGNYAGYAYPPGSYSNNFILDGVVIVPSNNDVNSDIPVFIHEVGHFLGLYHTFEGNSCSKANNINDYVLDTPQHLLDPVETNCRTLNRNTCKYLPGSDPVYNFMTYSAYTNCMKEFTLGQIERMTGQFELYRLGNRTYIPTISPTTSPPTSYQCKNTFDSCNSNEDCCSEQCGILFGIIRICSSRLFSFFK